MVGARLDHGTRSPQYLDLFEELNASGVMVVVVTHDAEVATRTQRVVELRDGLIVAGEPSEVV